MELLRITALRLKQLAIFANSLLFSCYAYAGPTMDESQNGVAAGFNSFVSKVGALTHTAITNSSFTSEIEVEFLFFNIVLVAWLLIRWQFGGLPTWEIFSNGITVLIDKVLIMYYDTITTALWNAFDGFGAVLQGAMLGTTDLFFAPAFVTNLMKSLTFASDTGWDVFAAFSAAIQIEIISFCMLVLSILAYISSIWGFWGYTLAKLIGLIFIPTLLFKPLHFLFDGWLRFFFGWLVYTLVARLNLVLMACAIALYFGVGLPPTITTVSATEIPTISSIFELLGLLTFVFVGILAMFSTGRFAASIVAGAGGGGMGPAILSVARTIGQMAAG